jgi:hypothetical protein
MTDESVKFRTACEIIIVIMTAALLIFTLMI